VELSARTLLVTLPADLQFLTDPRTLAQQPVVQGLGFT
jgi:hypothetical protein